MGREGPPSMAIPSNGHSGRLARRRVTRPLWEETGGSASRNAAGTTPSNKALASSEHDRMEVQVEPVDKVCLEQAQPRQGAAADHVDLVETVLQSPHLGPNVGYHCGTRPRRVG